MKKKFEKKIIPEFLGNVQSEVITMDIVGEFLGKDTDTGIWRYFNEHWSSWFPGLGSRWQSTASNYNTKHKPLTNVNKYINILIGRKNNKILMHWTIHYYNQSVKEDLRSLPISIRAKFMAIISKIQENGPFLGLPFTKAMGNGLFEIRAKGQEGIARGMFCIEVKHHDI